MKSLALPAILIAAAACTAAPGDPADPAGRAAIDAELDRYEQQWAALAMKPDSDGLLERIIADDFSGQSDDGTVRSKREEIAFWARQPGTFAAAGPVAMRFHHYGDTVVGHGRQTLRFAAGGAPLRLVWTDTWMKRGGRWQVVASQDAVLPPTAAARPGDDMG